MTLELAAIVVVVFLLATAWLIAKDKSIKEDEHAGDVYAKHIEEYRKAFERQITATAVGNRPSFVLPVPPRKKQASRKRSKAGGRRAKRKSGGNRK